MKTCLSISSVRRLIIVICLAVVSSTQAQETSTNEFSARAAINQRLQHVQSELQQHASDSDRQTYQLLKQLETTIYHHQAAIGFLAVKKRQREKTAELTRTWDGFDQPAPYSILFSDDLRMKLLSLQVLQRGVDSRLAVITQLTRDTVNQLSELERSEHQLTEMAELGEGAESTQAILFSLQNNNISTRIGVN